MACRLFGAKPLPEPMLVYGQLDSWEHISMTVDRNSIIIIQENAIENVVCQNGGRFVQGEISWLVFFIYKFLWDVISHPYHNFS